MGAQSRSTTKGQIIERTCLWIQDRTRKRNGTERVGDTRVGNLTPFLSARGSSRLLSVYPLYYVLEMEANSCLETRRIRYKLETKLGAAEGGAEGRSVGLSILAESEKSERRRRNERKGERDRERGKKSRGGSSLMKADRGAVVLVRALVRLAPSRVGVKWSRRLEDLSNNVRSAKNVRRDTKVQLRVPPPPLSLRRRVLAVKATPVFERCRVPEEYSFLCLSSTNSIFPAVFLPLYPAGYRSVAFH